MKIEDFSFGSIRIDGTTYKYDVVIDRGKHHTRPNTSASRRCLGQPMAWGCARGIFAVGVLRA